jgi:feruloyl esterase
MTRTPATPSGDDSKLRRMALLGALAAATAALAACGGSDDAPAPPPPPPAPVALACDDTLKTAFVPDANTKVTLVKAFKQGDILTLSGATTGTAAANDVCLVKLMVGPGNAGPASAPSTSAGIGIEVWLPAQARWNNRVRVLGGGGWAGGAAISSLTAIGGANAAALAASEGSVTAVTDTGHTVAGTGSFAMNADGSINTTLWKDFSERGIHEMAVKTKALAAGFFLVAPKYSYWDGCSTGGRQGHKEAQANPADFDGILAGAPAFNWSKFIVNELYPQVVMQRDLGGVPLTAGQLALVSAAAVSACDTNLNGQHDGYVSDPAQCRYDPTQDTAVLCAASGGTSTSASCVSSVQAQAFNKMWYGQTTDGSVPSPAADVGYNINTSPNQLWFGLTRGTALNGLAGSAAGVPTPFTIASDMVALALQDPTYATPGFLDAVGNGADRWKTLGYADLANAWYQGVALQTSFADINTDNPDLTAFRDRGGKLLMYHGLADVLIAPQGSINYYTRASNLMGGYATTQKFYRLFMVPGMGHCSGIGSANGTAGVSPPANPPLPANNQLFNVLVDWVENGKAPDTITVQTADAAISRPLCLHPKNSRTRAVT